MRTQEIQSFGDPLNSFNEACVEVLPLSTTHDVARWIITYMSWASQTSDKVHARYDSGVMYREVPRTIVMPHSMSRSECI